MKSTLDEERALHSTVCKFMFGELMSIKQVRRRAGLGCISMRDCV